MIYSIKVGRFCLFSELNCLLCKIGENIFFLILFVVKISKTISSENVNKKGVQSDANTSLTFRQTFNLNIYVSFYFNWNLINASMWQMNWCKSILVAHCRWGKVRAFA